MKPKRMLLCLASALVLSICLSPAALAQSDDECKKKPFTYDNGPLGQRHWCGACNLDSSKRQAPINIDPARATRDPNLPKLDFLGYKATQLSVDKKYHNLKIDYKNGDSYIKIGTDTFKLVEFHFHRPSEEAIDNRRTAMVIHLVHESVTQPGSLAVVAILVKAGQPDEKTKKLVDTLIQNAPVVNGPVAPQDVEINAADLLPAGSFPENHSYFRYEGSLTTPGCGEGVMFYVLKTSVYFSAEQLKQFEVRYPFASARNIQATNGREVKQTVR